MSGKNRIEVDRVLEKIIQPYFHGIPDELSAAERAVSAGEWRAAISIGHNLKGSGTGYGLPEVSRLGAMLEEAAKDQRPEQCREAIESLRAYLPTVELVFRG